MIAIVIPYYKITFFRDTLNSLANQTDKRFNVYIGDDASPESPLELLKEFEGEFNFQYQYFKENLGRESLTKQWIRCIELCKGEEWLMILGDDDKLSPKVIEEFYEILKHKEQSDYVLRYRRQIINAKGEIISPKSDFPDNELSIDFLYKRTKNQAVSSLSEFIFRKEDYARHGLRAYPNGFYSDNWMQLVYSDFGRIKNINATCYIRITTISLSGNPENREKVLEAGLYFYRDLLTIYPHKFSKAQKSLFLNILMNGINHPKFPMNEFQFLKLSFSTVGSLLTLRKTLTLIKMKISKG